jgi:hypothetical protein
MIVNVATKLPLFSELLLMRPAPRAVGSSTDYKLKCR